MEGCSLVPRLYSSLAVKHGDEARMDGWMDSKDCSLRMIYFVFLLMQVSIAVGPLVLYITSFIVTLCVKRINKKVGEKVRYTAL